MVTKQWNLEALFCAGTHAAILDTELNSELSSADCLIYNSNLFTTLTGGLQISKFK